MRKHDDSGPAFPSMEQWEVWCEEKAAYVPRTAPTGGMSLRDYFAGQALMHARDSFDPGLASSADRARKAYLDADAMLSERAK